MIVLFHIKLPSNGKLSFVLFCSSFLSACLLVALYLTVAYPISTWPIVWDLFQRAYIKRYRCVPREFHCTEVAQYFNLLETLKFLVLLHWSFLQLHFSTCL